MESGGVLLSTVKRNVLVGRLCLFCIGLSLLHIAIDASLGLYDSVVMDFVFGVVIFLAYLLNRRGYHKLAKIFVLSVLNILFAVFVSVLPKEVGIYLYYFPLIIGSSAVFETSDRFYRYLFIAIPLVLLCLLIMADFDLLPGMAFQSPLNNNVFFAVNAFSTAAITIICVSFMQRLNVSSEAELKQLAEEVHAKNIHLEKTNAELDRFLYSTSHDLRSPLSSIKGLVNIARMETSDRHLDRYFDMMVDRVDKLDFFIKDIIDYSKNARTEVRHEPVDFSALITEVADNLKYLEGADSIQVKTDIVLGQAVKADKNRLAVILNNLLANAIKYHDPRKEEQWINVQVRNSNGTIKLRVSDNGIGIDPEHHSKIFDMFYRGTFQSKGSGLGLYIVKEAITKMNGSISVESTPGKGSSFLITLPTA